MKPLLDVSRLSLSAEGRVLVSEISFSIAQGQRFGLIGESGSGKSLTAMAVTGLLPKSIDAHGSVRLNGQEVVGTSERVLNTMRGRDVAVVFQEPLTALDPLMRLGQQIAIPLKRRLTREGEDTGSAALRRGVLELLEHVSLPQPDRILRAFPHEISGGQRQRVAIALALACRPRLLIADEPTTALDVTTQAEILKLLDRLVGEFDMSLLFISHDLPVVASVVSDVAVMQHGQLVEEGTIGDVFGAPSHPYTRSLVKAAHAFDSYFGEASS
ncbi:ATP-binding cassette domain-containing protein [Martelella mediterranea]|uniref:ABC-type dipeptide/oligopeptide/nickel transport system ATPase component n=1 Tax=Martelella mediterranea TaxID=293089 RepID=A0A4R3NP16_9HYPH|nr:ABC transporter ATP-binding protein [Martelella mediterranea]TCT37147.1 ABC-type dipeptide/oligopeptide/nickel transport system ATPase component [Martelella mediterranea]